MMDVAMADQSAMVFDSDQSGAGGKRPIRPPQAATILGRGGRPLLPVRTEK
jgi:hypothetical protein